MSLVAKTILAKNSANNGALYVGSGATIGALVLDSNPATSVAANAIIRYAFGSSSDTGKWEVVYDPAVYGSAHGYVSLPNMPLAGDQTQPIEFAGEIAGCTPLILATSKLPGINNNGGPLVGTDDSAIINAAIIQIANNPGGGTLVIDGHHAIMNSIILDGRVKCEGRDNGTGLAHFYAFGSLAGGNDVPPLCNRRMRKAISGGFLGIDNPQSLPLWSGVGGGTVAVPVVLADNVTAGTPNTNITITLGTKQSKLIDPVCTLPSPYATTDPIHLVLDYGTPSAEVVTVVSVNTSTDVVTVTLGANPQAHSAGAIVEQLVEDTLLDLRGIWLECQGSTYGSGWTQGFFGSGLMLCGVRSVKLRDIKVANAAVYAICLQNIEWLDWDLGDTNQSAEGDDAVHVFGPAGDWLINRLYADGGNTALSLAFTENALDTYLGDPYIGFGGCRRCVIRESSMDGSPGAANLSGSNVCNVQSLRFERCELNGTGGAFYVQFPGQASGSDLWQGIGSVVFQDCLLPGGTGNDGAIANVAGQIGELTLENVTAATIGATKPLVYNAQSIGTVVVDGVVNPGNGPLIGNHGAIGTVVQGDYAAAAFITGNAPGQIVPAAAPPAGSVVSYSPCYTLGAGLRDNANSQAVMGTFGNYGPIPIPGGGYGYGYFLTIGSITYALAFPSFEGHWIMVSYPTSSPGSFGICASCPSTNAVSGVGTYTGQGDLSGSAAATIAAGIVTTIISDALTAPIGAGVLFTSGANGGLFAQITANATGILTIGPGLATAPAVNDTFVVVPAAALTNHAAIQADVTAATTGLVTAATATITAAITAAALTTSAIAAAVWSYLCTAADTLGVTTIGGWLRATLNAVLGRVQNTPIQVQALVQPGGAISLEQYCSYKAERGNPLAIAVNVPFDLTGADVHLWIAPQSNGTPVMPPKLDISACTVIGPATAATGLSADLPSAGTGALTNLSPAAYAWCFVAYYPAVGDQVPITAWSDCTVTPGVTLTS